MKSDGLCHAPGSIFPVGDTVLPRVTHRVRGGSGAWNYCGLVVNEEFKSIQGEFKSAGFKTPGKAGGGSRRLQDATGT